MAYLRLPRRLGSTAKQEQLTAFRNWLSKAASRRPDLMSAHTPTVYVSGNVYVLGQLEVRLHLEQEQRKSGSGHIIPDPHAPARLEAMLKIPQGLAEDERSKLIERLLFRLTAKQFTPQVEALLDEVNDAHFQVDVGRIKLSATTSRWGSCSSKGNVNLSTRLLGAPSMCLRAVIVHELAHRIEMNHSERFWKLVHDAMPSYVEADAWLKQHGAGLRWVAKS